MEHEVSDDSEEEKSEHTAKQVFSETQSKTTQHTMVSGKSGKETSIVRMPFR